MRRALSVLRSVVLAVLTAPAKGSVVVSILLVGSVLKVLLVSGDLIVLRYCSDAQHVGHLHEKTPDSPLEEKLESSPPQ